MASVTPEILSAIKAFDINYSNNIKNLNMHFTLDSLQQLESSEDQHFWHINRKYLVKKLIEQHKPKNFKGVDIGCGNGSIISAMEKKFPASQWTGIDGYLDGLINARKRTKKAALEWQDITSLEDLKNKKYDVVLLLDVLEHLDYPERVIQQLDKVLAKDAIVIATVPADMKLWSDRDSFLGHRKRYLKAELTALFKDNGFEVVNSNYCFSHLYLPAWFFRKILSARSSGQEVEEKELKIRPVINPLMSFLGNIEMKTSMHIKLPFGTSTWCIAQKR